jgi:hypothetical protein
MSLVADVPDSDLGLDLPNNRANMKVCFCMQNNLLLGFNG